MMLDQPTCEVTANMLMLPKCENAKYFSVLGLKIGECLDMQGQSGIVLDVVPRRNHPLFLWLPAKYAPVNIAVCFWHTNVQMRI